MRYGEQGGGVGQSIEKGSAPSAPGNGRNGTGGTATGHTGAGRRTAQLPGEEFR